MNELQWKTVDVIGFDELTRALDRADLKGYMPDAIREEWEAFNWKEHPEQPAKEKAPQSANCEAPGWISSDHARRNDCTTKQPYPDNFIDALKYDVAKRDSEAQQAYEDAFVNGTGVMLGDKRIDPASIYKQPAQQEPVAYMVKAHGMLQRLSRRADVADEIACQYRKDDPNAEVFPLYTTPSQREPLTDEQIQEVVTKAVRERKLSWLGFKKDDQGEYTIPVLSSSDYQMARAIEAAHGIGEEK